MRRSLRRGCVLVAALALVAGACGGRDDDDDTSAGTSASTAASTTTAAGGGTTASTATGDTTATTADDGTAFGDAPWPCGPGDASGATEQGVTDTEIRIASGDDRGFVNAPGLNHQMG